MPSGHKEPASNVEKAYEMLKELLIVYRFKPGGRINEDELARQLSVCRTPPRGILNWLTSQGFLRFISGRGLFYRELQSPEISEFYQLRTVLNAIRRQDADAAAAAMESHISRRLDEITGGIKEGLLRIYLVEYAAE